VSETEKPKTGLIAALVAAQADVKPVAKDSRNEFHRYNYASADDVIAAARAALDKHDLAVFQAGWKLDAGMVSVHYEVQHAGTGETMGIDVNLPVIEEKGRPMDKALFGALTEGLSYFLRGLLLIPREDSSDTPSARDDSKYQPAPKPAAPAPPAGAKPLTPWQVTFSKDAAVLFKGVAADVVKGKIAVAGKTFLGDGFDGNWRALNEKELADLEVILRANKTAADDKAAQ
jgi:hypothetical protein